MIKIQETDKVKDFELEHAKTYNDLIRQMYDSGGFTAKKVGIGVDILETMFKEDECVNFLSFPANIIATGTRGVIKDLVKHKWQTS
jgi:deoxyhypusine synthase